jgi:glycosyltransferase involved in cell wall biosynthesis
MLAYTFYENDGRVMRYAQSLVHAGARVDVVVLRKAGQPNVEVVEGVRVIRIQQRARDESRKFDYLWRILKFFLRSMVEVSRRHLQQPYDVVHVHSVPDFEVFAAWLPKFLGARVILDIHDIVPEFYAAKFNVRHDSVVFGALRWVERLSSGFADHVIAANDLWRDKLIARSVREAKCTAIVNYPDTAIFHPTARTRVDDDGRFVMIYPGSLHPHQGLDVALKAFRIVADKLPGAEFHIYGEGPAKAALEQLRHELRLEEQVRMNAPLPIRLIAQLMANADLGVVPKRDDSFGGEAFSTKILEFMAVGTPLVVSATRVDKYYFNETMLRFFEPGNAADLAASMLAAYSDRAEGRRLASNAQAHALRMSWANKRSEYVGMVTALAAGR